jgi:photosystem II stability/assembly factor-like uncharacterized protein
MMVEWGGNPGEAEVLPKLGWMTESLEINPFNSDEMMYGTGATIYGSSNLTAWDTGGTVLISVMCEGLEETSVLSLISPPEGPHLISGLGDIYGFTHNSLDVVPDAFFSDPQIATTSMDYAELNPGFIYRVGNGGEEINYVVQKSSGSSTDGGATWTMNWNEPEGITEGGIVAVGADGSNVVWSPKGTGVHYSLTSGSNWNASSGIPDEAVVASDRVNPETFYGCSEGTFYVSTDGGVTFTSTATGLPTSAQVNGTRGIYRSDDGGDSWIRVNDDEHQWAWTGECITGDPRIPGCVYISTNGRGIIYGDPAGGVVTGPPTPTPTPTPTETPSPTPDQGPDPGDVNEDGTIDSNDALLTAQYYVGLNPVECNPDLADVDCDGDVDIVDALLIIQFYLGLITALGC